MEKLTSIKEEGLTRIEACEDLAQLQQLRVLYLGKKGPIQEVMKSMKDLPKEERPAFGQQVNEVKTLFANAIEERRAVLEVAEMEKKNRRRKNRYHPFRSEAESGKCTSAHDRPAGNGGFVHRFGLHGRGRPGSGDGSL